MPKFSGTYYSSKSQITKEVTCDTTVCNTAAWMRRNAQKYALWCHDVHSDRLCSATVRASGGREAGRPEPAASTGASGGREAGRPEPAASTGASGGREAGISLLWAATYSFGTVVYAPGYILQYVYTLAPHRCASGCAP